MLKVFFLHPQTFNYKLIRMKKKTPSVKRFFLSLALLSFGPWALSQSMDSTAGPKPAASQANISGSISLTNNGISIIPAFSLNKPAGTFDVSMSRGRLSFDPEFSCSLDGKPWNIFLWLRYQAVKQSRWNLTLAVHPDFAFSTEALSTGGVIHNYTTAQRYLSFDFAPNYMVSKKVSVGIFYLYSRGLSEISIKNGHYLTLHGTLSKIPLGDNFSFDFTPQVYYLKLDAQDGFYFTSTLSLSRKDFPLSVSGFMNTIVKTHITGSPRLNWNLSLTYAFH